MLSLSLLAVVANLFTTVYGQPTETVEAGRLEMRQETPTSSDTAPTQTILVGAQGFLFSPNNIKAAVGSTIGIAGVSYALFKLQNIN
jgi:hypothetical protein